MKSSCLPFSLSRINERHSDFLFWRIFFKKLFHEPMQKNALYLSVNVFSTEVLFGDTILTSPTGDGTAILRGHPSRAKV